ncbi:MAG: PHP domain-containing protein [bacterium]|nr:PHP domain-containing protein [bacterium]
MRYVDLHLHTHYSDGTDAPRLVIERASELGFAAAAITDHDTVAGVAEGQRAAEELGVEFLPGVEVSCECRGREIHVLGYGIDLGHQGLLDALNELVEGRATRADRIIAKLNEMGVPISREDLEDRGDDAGSIGRMHIAREVHARGFSRTVQDAFDKYLKSKRPAYVDKPRLACADAIELIRDAGGLAFLAHPGLGNQNRSIAPLLEFPFDGIEVYHTRHTGGQETEFLLIAEERGLLVSGGSDCHGTAKQDPEMGKVRMPYEHFARLAAALEGERNPIRGKEY